MKHIWASFRAWWTRAWLPDASGCFSTAVIINHLSERKGTTKSNLGKFVTLSRDNKCKLPYLIGWLYATSAARNFCLTITSNSWLVKVSQYDINVCFFLVGVALCVCAGVLGRCGVVAFLRRSFFFFGPFCSLSFYSLFFLFFFILSLDIYIYIYVFLLSSLLFLVSVEYMHLTQCLTFSHAWPRCRRFLVGTAFLKCGSAGLGS